MKYAQSLFIFTLLILVGFFYGVIPLRKDGYGYFHSGKTLIDVGDFSTKNKPEYYEETDYAVEYYNDSYITIYPPGTSILQTPFLLIGKKFENIDLNNFKNQYGHSISYGVMILLSSITYFYLTIILQFGFLKNIGFSNKNSLTAVLLGVITSLVPAYVFEFPSYAHIYELFIYSAILFCLSLLNKKKFNRQWKTLSIAIGFCSGLLVLTKPVNILIVLPILLYLAIYKNKKYLIGVIVSAIPCALVYFAYNLSSFGKLFVFGQSILGWTSYDLNQFNLFRLFFSDIRGWFIYSPLMLLGLIALITYTKKTFKFILYLLPVILIFINYSFWNNYWAGVSVGQRFFIILSPLMSIGLAHLIKTVNQKSCTLRHFAFSIIGILTLYSASLYLLIRITPMEKLRDIYPREESHHPETRMDEKYTPIDVYRYHYDLMVDKETNYIEVILENFESTPTLYFLIK